MSNLSGLVESPFVLFPKGVQVGKSPLQVNLFNFLKAVSDRNILGRA
jgi:hypothetical protein